MRKTPSLAISYYPTVTPANWAEVDSPRKRTNKPNRRLSFRALRKIRKDGL
jgi:hypothetical protein